MPNFASPFSEPLNGRKLTSEELIRAIRFVIAAEYEAAQMYMQIVEATDNELVKKVLTSVTDEERVHAGEFLKVLHELAPDEAEHYKEGEKEVKKEIKKDETSEVTEESIRLSESVKKLFRMIEDKTVTAEDFNRFIAETSPTSINKRVQRQLRPKKVGPQVSSPGRKVDDKTDHEPADHNDPTTTSRGRRSLQRQIKRNKAHPEQFREAIEFLRNNNGKPLSECKAALDDIANLGSLCRIATRLSQRPSQYDSEWLLNLVKHLRGN